jgi:hypothetical protein
MKGFYTCLCRCPAYREAVARPVERVTDDLETSSLDKRCCRVVPAESIGGPARPRPGHGQGQCRPGPKESSLRAFSSTSPSSVVIPPPWVEAARFWSCNLWMGLYQEVAQELDEQNMDYQRTPRAIISSQ